MMICFGGVACIALAKDSIGADFAAIINITPDHLDRYDNSLEKYIAAKFKIFENQTEEDFAINSDDDELIQQHLKKHKIKARQIPFTIKKKTNEVPMLKMAA